MKDEGRVGDIRWKCRGCGVIHAAIDLVGGFCRACLQEPVKNMHGEVTFDSIMAFMKRQANRR